MFMLLQCIERAFDLKSSALALCWGTKIFSASINSERKIFSLLSQEIRRAYFYKHFQKYIQKLENSTENC